MAGNTVGCGAAFRCLLVATALCLLPPASQSAPPSPAAFGRLPAMDNVDLSPNGRFVAWSEATESGHIVVMFDLANRKQLRAISAGDYIKLRDLRWADDETLLITVSRTVMPRYGDRKQAVEYFRTQAVDLVGEGGRTLLMQQGHMDLVSDSKIVAFHPPTPKTVIMASFDFTAATTSGNVDTRIGEKRSKSGWNNNLYAVDTRTGAGRKIAAGDNYTVDWVVDRAGLPVARSQFDLDEDKDAALFRIQVKDGAGWREIYRQTDGERLALAGLTADGRSIVALGARGQPRDALWAFPLDGSAPQALVADPELDVSAVAMDRFTGTPVSVRLGGADTPTRWLDPAAEKRARAVGRAFPGKDVLVWGRSMDGRRILARVSSPSQPPVYYLVDFDARSADIIGEAYPELADQALGEVRSLSYKARDGYDVPAYLTLPPGREPANLPLVVLPHGGPESRDTGEFDWWPQFLASRGYAVLQPQFRGSTGFGEAHRLAGVRQWGKRMQDDVSDGVQAMIEQKIADARRICIVGHSYGGYSALAGATFTPELYACAASVNGVSDLPLMLGAVQERMGKEADQLDYWRDRIGEPRDPDVIARSPARHAAAVRAPVLLLHGADDTVVPMAQSELMDRRLTEQGKPHRFVKLTGDDHWMSRSATRIQMLTELDRFLAEHLQPAPSP